jgi:hypothetical protein
MLAEWFARRDDELQRLGGVAQLEGAGGPGIVFAVDEEQPLPLVFTQVSMSRMTAGS